VGCITGCINVNVWKTVETDITTIAIVVELLITDLVTSLTRDIGTRIEDYILLIIVKFRHVIV
jgi:hypothetical protein